MGNADVDIPICMEIIRYMCYFAMDDPKFTRQFITLLLIFIIYEGVNI
jgi:hypothetical protein